DLAVGWLAALALLVTGVSSFEYHFAVAMVPASLALGEIVTAPHVGCKHPTGEWRQS
nr:hypothetical protein [Acidimicrobiia bacterium]